MENIHAWRRGVCLRQTRHILDDQRRDMGIHHVARPATLDQRWDVLSLGLPQSPSPSRNRQSGGYVVLGDEILRRASVPFREPRWAS